MILEELSENKSLIKIGQGDSSSGSDSAPSDDNLNPADLLKNLPVADKVMKTKIKQIESEKKSPTKLPSREVRITSKPPKESPIKLKQESNKLVRPFNQPIPVKVVEPSEEKKKVKPEMKDAVSQTDRSDWQIIKAKMAREKQAQEAGASFKVDYST